MSTREIQRHLAEIDSVEVSPALISQVTDAVQEEVTLWQSRPLDALYPIIYLNALQVKIRDGAHVRNKAIYLVLGVNLQGLKEVLGWWIEQTEAAKFWLQILTDLRHRGVRDIFRSVRGWTQRFPGSHRDGLSAGASPTLHRASCAKVCSMSAIRNARLSPPLCNGCIGQ